MPSAVKWLDEVPAHWQTVRAKWLFTKMNRRVRKDDEVVTCFRDGTVTLRRNRRELGFTESLKEIGYQGVRRGDLVIHTMDAFAGACGVADSDGKSTPVYSVCAPKDERANPRYYAFFVREMARTGWILALSRGVRERSTDFRFAAFGDQLMPLPPSREQSAIVRFLEHADWRIRRYIRIKEKLIELLEEQKLAIIHQAVTGQMDVRTGQPYRICKDSGVEWFGKVPAHWDVRPLCSVATVKAIRQKQHRQLLSVYLNRGVIRFSDVREKRTNPTSEDLSQYQAVDVGDLVLNNQQAWRGSVGVSMLSGIVSPAYLVLTLDRSFHAGFADFVFRSRLMVAHFRVSSRGVGSIQRSLYWPHLKRVPVAVPPISEQVAICRFLDRELARINMAVAQTERESALADEYRTRLIADVVTGKRDVREAAAALPEADPRTVDEEGDDVTASTAGYSMESDTTLPEACT